MDEQRALGAPIPTEAITGIKAGLMGPFAGIGDTIDWSTLRPLLIALVLPLAENGSFLAPIIYGILSVSYTHLADATLLSGQIEANEALLTGESDPIHKNPGDTVLSGSFVISGKCAAVVDHVGAENYATKLSAEAKKLKKLHSELMTSMQKVTRFTGFFIVPLGIILFLEAILLRQTALPDAVISTSAGLLGMLPKGLVLLISISLAVGVIRLAKKQILVQALFSLETLAHVDVLCLDKTGTLTEEMCIRDRLYTLSLSPDSLGPPKWQNTPSYSEANAVKYCRALRTGPMTSGILLFLSLIHI